MEVIRSYLLADALSILSKAVDVKNKLQYLRELNGPLALQIDTDTKIALICGEIALLNGIHPQLYSQSQIGSYEELQEIAGKLSVSLRKIEPIKTIVTQAISASS